jgi:putative glutamine amidotransferase
MMYLLKIYCLFMFITASANPLQAQDQPLIAISRGSSSESYLAYGAWLKNIDREVRWVDMSVYPVDSALAILDKCSGLLLSGGDDVYPGRYGRESDTSRCDKPDHERDALEFALIRKAEELGLPVLGICRGLQILNVVYGGSLIIDIPQD